jgi:hypothetical protein
MQVSIERTTKLKWWSIQSTEQELAAISGPAISRTELAAIKLALQVAPELLMPDHTTNADNDEVASSNINSRICAANSNLNIATNSPTSMCHYGDGSPAPRICRNTGTNLYCRT